MKIVIDTNVLLVSISQKSKYHWIFKRIIDKEDILCVSNDILFEYFEIIENFMGVNSRISFSELIEYLPVRKVENYFRFDLLHDKDDNKFVDCYLASGADYLITQDKDFNFLKQIDFPQVNLLNINQLKTLVNN